MRQRLSALGTLASVAHRFLPQKRCRCDLERIPDTVERWRVREVQLRQIFERESSEESRGKHVNALGNSRSADCLRAEKPPLSDSTTSFSVSGCASGR